jgi:3-dehydroquinate dehydratase/shikimate dehydrogenase
MAVVPDRVCVVIGRTRHKMIQAELGEAAKRGHRFIELRLDFLVKAVEFKRFQPQKHCPWVATLRRPADGGRWSGSEEERRTVLRQCIVSGLFDWVDLETDVANDVRRFGPVKRIISYHNMAETPADLEAIYERMLKQDGDVYKLAVMANGPADLQRVVALQRAAPKPTVAFCMGEIGFPTRFLALKFGAPLIYAAFNRERGVAPGIPSADEFRTTYPVRGIGPATKVFGLLGDPVGHSLSPVLHNHMFRRLKQDAIYLPFRVPKGLLADAVAAARDVPVDGFSVTIPHKEYAAGLAAHADPAVHLTGAANTLLRNPDGSLTAANSDYTAAVECLQAHLAERAKLGPVPEFNQLFVLVLGTGGSARAVAHALHREGAHITVTGRNTDKATKLAADIGCKAVDWQGRHSLIATNVLVNCTPVGMTPDTDGMPIHTSFLKQDLIVFDLVYTPENTKLVREARTRGCQVVSGVDMFVRQAAVQFERFTGVAPPVDQMREIMRKAMSPLTRALDEEAERTERAEADDAAGDDDD